MAKISRRRFLGVALLPLFPTSIIVTGCNKTRSEKNATLFINGHIDGKGKHFISGFNAQGEENFRVSLPDNAHSFAVNPAKPNIIIALPSLPGTRAAVIDIVEGKLLTIINSQSGRHFNGHACFSPDGKRLFSSENKSETAEGVITVRDGDGYEVLREISGHGIGPHDIRMMADGKTIVVASGGIKTHPKSGKRELNINEMRSALLFIDTQTDKLVKRSEIPVPQLSIRHLDVGLNGEVLVACQYKGKRQLPKLVGVAYVDKDIEMLDIDEDNLWHMKNYTASARIAAGGIAAITCPRGDRVMFWNLQNKKLIKSLIIKDAGGIEITADRNRFIISANVGELYEVDTKNLDVKSLKNSGESWRNAKWTNHMVKTIA